jgi:hypothetical protein
MQRAELQTGAPLRMAYVCRTLNSLDMYAHVTELAAGVCRVSPLNRSWSYQPPLRSIPTDIPNVSLLRLGRWGLDSMGWEVAPVELSVALVLCVCSAFAEVFEL